nr:hypothetical protein [Tanacetum cinerariifolium]
MDFVSSPSTNSTNEVHTTYRVNTASTLSSTSSTQVGTTSTQTSTANLIDATVYAFLANQSNGSQLVHEDLEQIHEDDLEEMDLKWQLALLSMRAKREPKNQDSRNRYQDSSRITVHGEETPSKAMVAIDGVSFDSSYMAKDEVPTNMALMAFSDSESLDKLLGSQITNKRKNGLRLQSYNAIPPPATLVYNTRRCAPPKTDLSYSGLEEFKQPEFESYGPKSCEIKSKNAREDIPNELKEYPDALLVKDRLQIIKIAQLATITIKGKGWENQVNVVKASACWVWRPTKPNCASITLKKHNYIDGHPQKVKEDQGYVNSGCSRRGENGGRITGKGTIKTGNLDFEDVYFVKELKFNLLSVSQMCDRKNNILLKVPQKNNMYSVDMKNIVPKESLTCLVTKATLDESMLWHRRLSHIKFKNINKLVKDNLVRGLPLKRFENDQTCVACLKGKQHKSSSKSKI